MDFVHQVDLAVVFTEFVLCVDKDQAAFGSNFRTAFEEGERVFFQQFVFFGSGQTFSQDFFLGDVGVVFADLGFCRRGNDRFGETFVFTHAFRQFYTADFTHAALISTPCTSAEVAAYDHFNRKSLAHHAYGHHRIGSSQFPVRADVGSRIQEFGCDLVQHLSFVRDTFRQDYVECRDTVCCNHHQYIVVDVVHIAYFTMIDTLLSWEIEVCFC